MLYRQKRRKKIARSTDPGHLLSRMEKHSTEEITDEVILQEKKYQSMPDRFYQPAFRKPLPKIQITIPITTRTAL